MMEATEHGDGYYAPGPLHGPAERGIFSKREVRAGRIVVGRIGGQNPAKMGFAQHHDMVEALPGWNGSAAQHGRSATASAGRSVGPEYPWLAADW